MKNIISTLLCSIILSSCILGQKTNKTGWEYSGELEFISMLPYMKSKYCKDITILPRGHYTRNLSNGNYEQFTDGDSTLLYPAPPFRDSIASFYMSEHEVTNSEYREFVHWVRDSIARRKLFIRLPKSNKHKWGSYTSTTTENVDSSGRYFKLNWNSKLNYDDPEIAFLLGDMYMSSDRFYPRREVDARKLWYTYLRTDTRDNESVKTILNIYPDTLCWMRIFNTYNNPMANMYFWHPAYDNHPVVGITWTQAQAYCDWRTERYREEVGKLSKRKRAKYSDDVRFTLPTSRQWSYASRQPLSAYGWKIQPYDHTSKGYTANFGPMILNSGIRIKGHPEDGSFHTSQVKSYPDNFFGLYDMFGNVAEWTQDNPTKPDNFFENLIERFQSLSYIPFDVYNKEFINDSTQNIKSLYITDPYSSTTHLVSRNSSEHKRILNLRLKYYNIGPHASHEEILENYLAFHSVDSTYRDRIDSLNSIKKESYTVPSGNLDGVHILVEIPPAYETAISLYNNYSGLYSERKRDWTLRRYLQVIMELKHNWEVIERAERSYINTVFIGDKPFDNDCRLVQGGSWYDQPHYLNSACYEVYNEAEASSKIGFRVVMDALILDYKGICSNCTHKNRKKLKKYWNASEDKQKH